MNRTCSSSPVLLTWLPLVGLLACGGSSEPLAPPPPPPPAGPAVVEVAPPAASASASPAAPLPDVEFGPGEAAPAPEKAPVISLKAPTNGQVIPADKAPDAEVKLDLKGWEIPGPGNHVHLILDNRPYKRVDDAKQPVKLKDIDPTYQLGEGQHVIVAFPSRPTHESVKPVGKAVPLAATTFFIGKKGDAAWKVKDPMLIYSRPKGNNPAPPPEGVLVDFYLANAELGDGKFTVEATLKGPGVEEGKKVTIKEWKPYRIKNARTGTYSLHVTLLDKAGKPVPGAWNDTTREFQVDLNAAPEPHHPPPPPSGSASAAPATTPPKMKKLSSSVP